MSAAKLQRLRDIARIWICAWAGLVTDCSQPAADRLLSSGHAGSSMPPNNTGVGTAGRIAGAPTPSDNPVSNWTGANPASPSDPAGADTSDDDAGTHERAVNLDPTVKFAWPESSQATGTHDNCKAGTYEGTFTCVFMVMGLAETMIELTGPVSLTFMKSMDGEFLEISNGDFSALANLIIGARAKIRGRLDCNTLMLDAMAVDGQWALGDPDLPLLPGGELQGQITGLLDASTGQLSGQWTFGDPALGSCPGTWSVIHAP